jgi:hypothetical protein
VGEPSAAAMASAVHDADNRFSPASKPTHPPSHAFAYPRAFRAAAARPGGLGGLHVLRLSCRGPRAAW